MKFTKWHNFVDYDLRRFAWGEFWRNFAKFHKLLAKFRLSHFAKQENCTLRNYVILLISCFASNIKKKWSTDWFESDDPRVYEPVCYEMLIAKEYYAQMFPVNDATCVWKNMTRIRPQPIVPLLIVQPVYLLTVSLSLQYALLSTPLECLTKSITKLDS